MEGHGAMMSLLSALFFFCQYKLPHTHTASLLLPNVASLEIIIVHTFMILLYVRDPK